MQQQPAAAAPAKTMFGYAAPVAKPAGMQGLPQGGAPPFAPPQQQGFPPQQAAPAAPPSYGAPAAQPSYGAPAAPPSYGAPAAAPAYGAPAAAQPFGAPAQQGGYGAPAPAPQPGYGAPPAAAPSYGQPQGGYGQDPYQQQQQGAYGAPSAQGGYPAAQQGGYGSQPQPAYGQPQGGYGQDAYGQQPAQPYGAAPGGYPQAQPSPQYGSYPSAQGYGSAPSDGGGLDDMARRLPQSQPGTLFGFPISRLRDPSVQRKFLFLAGIALVASIVVPISLSPTIFPFSSGMPKFNGLVWPIIAGAAYLLLTAAPPQMRQNIPPVVLQWIPFGVSFAGIMIAKVGLGALGAGGGGGLYVLAYATLVFGLLARIAQPQDQIARIIIAVGAGLLIPDYIDILKNVFEFGYPFLLIIHNLLWFLVLTLGVLCLTFVVPPQKLPPALRAVDAFGPLITAVLIAWLPLEVVLLGLAQLVHGHAGVSAILGIAHGLLPIVAYFGILMMSAPAAYEEAKAMLTKKGGGGGYPPQGGGYPPQGGGYPPQGGGYPPQGGGYPPQGGGYPPQGGGYPPQGGGGYPPQGGGNWQ
jgi:hypothetical protein